jgi:hypothetical protein
MSNANKQDGLPFNVNKWASTLAEWLEDHEAVLNGIVALRELGDEAYPAVTACLLVPRLRRMRHGWQLWEALADGEGVDAEVLLFDAAPARLIAVGHAAFWGETEFYDSELRLL